MANGAGLRILSLAVPGFKSQLSHSLSNGGIMDIDDVMAIAREAGRMMKEADRLEVTDKGSKENHVTNMDVAVQEFLRKRLTELLPGSSFVGEEQDYADRSGEYYWVVDPIDGTTNYIRNLQIAVTSIALVRGNEPVMGVVYNPFTDEMYHAERGKGAFRNGKPIHVSDRDVSHSIFATSWCAYDKTRSRRSFNISNRMFFICEDIRRMGAAAYEMCKLAEGRIDLYFEPILWPWDHAAASVIIEEAGGHITGERGCARLDDTDRVAAANTKDNLTYLTMVIDDEYSKE